MKEPGILVMKARAGNALLFLCMDVMSIPGSAPNRLEITSGLVTGLEWLNPDSGYEFWEFYKVPGKGQRILYDRSKKILCPTKIHLDM